MTIQKRILLIVTVLAAGWVALNLNYFSKNVQYYVAPDTVAQNSESSSAEKMEPNLLFIDSLGIRAPINYVDQADEDVFQESLQTGVVHYPGTAKLGENGNAYIFGHSSDNAWAKGDYKTVFALLPQVEIGTIGKTVELLRAEGEMIFDVDRSL